MFDHLFKPNSRLWDPGGKPPQAGDPRASAPPPQAAKKPEAAPEEDPSIARNRASLEANKRGEGGADTMTPDQQKSLETQLWQFDNLPAGIAEMMAKSKLMEEDAQKARNE